MLPLRFPASASGSLNRSFLVAALALSACTSALAGSQKVVPFSAVPDPVPDVIGRSQLVGHADPNQVMHVSVNMLPPNMAALQAYADSVSDPTSPNYRKFITPTQIGQMFGQPTSVVNGVVNYLRSNGLSITLVAKDNLHVLADGTVSQVEAAFHTTINNFHALNTSEPGRADYFSFSKVPQLPSELAAVTQHISGLQNQTKPRHLTTLTPNQERVLYGVQPFSTNGLNGEGRTLAYSNWDGFRTSNLTKWYSTYSLPAPSGGVGSNVTIVKIDGGSGTGSPGAEGDLDMQMILGQAPKCNLYIYDGNESGSGEPNDVLTKELDDNLADVISESYGWNMGSSAMSSCHTTHTEMTTAGITYMSASGDSGTSLSPYVYPDIEPEVLVVGGSAAAVDSTGNRQNEQTWLDGGGGWATTSISFNTLPSWQRATGCPTNINFRLIPDVAAQASGNTQFTQNAVFFVYNGSLSTVSGTSAASPAFDGGLGIAEQQLINVGYLTANGAGKYRMGRINDLFYSQNLRSDVWYDITTGDSNGSLPNGSTSNPTTGWDFCTGLGAINWQGFVNSLTSGASPSISSISPTSTTVGNSVSLTVNGSNFVSGSTVKWNGTSLSTSFVSSSQLTATIPSSDTGTAGTDSITVTNPGGATSNSATFTVNNPSPTLSSVSPNSINAGSGATTITLTGTNFVNGSTANVNGSAISTSFVSSTSLTATVPASDLTVSGTLSITVTNAGPGGGTSGAKTISVVPTISSISPTSATQNTSFTLTVNGTGFDSGAVVNFNGTALTTTFVSSTQVTAAVTATQTANTGSFPITVTDEGQTSNSASIQINTPAGPSISSISPTSVAAGSAFTLTVNGSNFDSGAMVNFNGTAIPTTFVSSTQVTATVSSSNTATAGTDAITVTDNSQTSNSANLTVNAPTVSSISPTSQTTGASFTLTVNGTNFISGSSINWNGTAVATTFVSSTQLTASITSTQDGTAGTYPISVTNPGGSTSNSISITINSQSQNPVPSITTVIPPLLIHGAPATTITLNGTGFIASSSVMINGTAIATTYHSGAMLTAVIPASMIASPTTLTVTVFNPAPGGGTSNAKTIIVH